MDLVTIQPGRAGDARSRQWLVPAFAAVVVVLAVGLGLSVIVANQTEGLISSIPTGVLGKDRADLLLSAFQYRADSLIKLWTIIVQLIGAGVLAIGGYFTWRNLRLAQQSLDETRKKAEADWRATTATLDATHASLQIDRESQITNRFTQAIGQLGAERSDGQPNLPVRLGGIYALEGIARADANKYHWPIMEILTAYVRENARWTAPLTSERSTTLEAATSDNLLAEFVAASKEESVSVEDTLSKGQKWLEAATRDQDQTIAKYREIADRMEAEQDEEDPKPRIDVQAILTVLGRRDTQQPEPHPLELGFTDLRGADFRAAHLEKVNFWHAHLERAMFFEAHLVNAYLSDSHLDLANFWLADLNGANLTHASVAFAGFEHALGLTRDQIASTATAGEGAQLPQGLLVGANSNDKQLAREVEVLG